MRSRRLVFLTVPVVLVLVLVLALAWLAGRGPHAPAPSAAPAPGEWAPDSARHGASLDSAAAQDPFAPPEVLPERSEAQGTPPPPSTLANSEPAEARIDGLVLRPDGRPAARARVQYLECDPNGWPNGREDSTVSDDDGRFTIRPAPPGLLQLVATHDEFAPNEPFPLTLAEGERKRDVQLRLRRFGRIEGSVRDARDAPRAGAAITCREFGAERALFATSEPGGGFVLEKVPPGTYEVSAAAEEKELAQLRGESTFLANSLARSSAAAIVNLAEGATARVQLGGIRPGSVRVFGCVRGAGGARVGVWLWATCPPDLDYDNLPHARTDERGEYVLWLPRQGPWHFELDCESRGVRLERTVEIRERVEQRVDFELPGGTVAGRVVDAGRRTLPGREIWLDSERAPGDTGDALASSWPRARSDAQGHFEFHDLPAGHYVLRAGPEGRSGDSEAHAFARVELDLAAGQQLADVEIVLAPECVLRGRVSFPAGVAPATARVVAFDEAGRPCAGARSEGDGSFVLRGLPEGRFAFQAECGAWISPISERQALEPGRERELELTLAAGVRPTLFVHPVPGTTPRMLWLRLTDARGFLIEAAEFPFADPAEPFWIVLCAPGSHVFELQGSDGSRGSETVTLEAGRETRIEIQLRRPK